MNVKFSMYVIIAFYCGVANALVPPWWITDDNKTWPKAFWIGAKFDSIEQDTFAKIKNIINKKFAEDGVSIAYFSQPRILITKGTVEDADAIRALYQMLEKISWKAIEKSLQINQLAVDYGLVGLRITYDQFPEFSKIRSDDLFLQFSRKKIQNLNYFVPRHGFILAFGYIKERNHGFIWPIDISETITINIDIKQLEFLVMPQIDPYKDASFEKTEKEFNKPMYHAGTFYARGVAKPKRPKNLMPGQRWQAPNKNSIALRVE